jgi:hypothetical protein
VQGDAFSLVCVLLGQPNHIIKNANIMLNDLLQLVDQQAAIKTRTIQVNVTGQVDKALGAIGGGQGGAVGQKPVVYDGRIPKAVVEDGNVGPWAQGVEIEAFFEQKF